MLLRDIPGLLTDVKIVSGPLPLLEFVFSGNKNTSRKYVPVPQGSKLQAGPIVEVLCAAQNLLPPTARKK
jgi:hypothetical protein